MQKFSKIIFYSYLILLVWMILFKFAPVEQMLATHRSINLVPFAQSGGRLEVLINILAFIPFGFMGFVVFKKTSFWLKIGMIIGLSFLFECLQFLFAIGASDITDIITNSFGGLLGLFAAYFYHKKSDKSDRNLTLITLFIILIILAFLIRTSVLRFG
jgi:glycopeptide antibiotics resistance protein